MARSSMKSPGDVPFRGAGVDVPVPGLVADRAGFSKYSGPFNPIAFLFLNDGDGWTATGYMWRNKNLSKKPGKAYFYADASLVPLPAAVWLFGSALLALFGFKRFGRRASRAA